MSAQFVTHPVFEQHEVPPGHPEHAGRIRSVWDAVQPLLDDGRLTSCEAPRAQRPQLALVHSQDYLDAVYSAAPQRGLVDLDSETTMGVHSLEAAERAAGAVCKAVDLIAQGNAERAFCAVRPPGHHARPDSVAGFCIFNNVAVGAAHALRLPQFERVAVVDFDVHHGDGTEAMFREHPSVLMCSTYQHPLYPGVNLPSIPGQQINVPLPAGTDGRLFRQAIDDEWIPALTDFGPDLIFVSAGFDAHEDDPLGGLRLQSADFAWATERVLSIARQNDHGRVIAVLEGGYDVASLGECVAAVCTVLAA